MTAVLSLEATWRAAHTENIPVALQPWLLEPASLTARLKAHSASFRLQLLSETAAPLPTFLHGSLPQQPQHCIRREVLMWCNDFPAVYAQSWLPASSISQLQQLAALGEQPLGELLFQFDDVTRSPIELAQITVAASSVVPSGTHWARRSVFTVATHPLLVAEVFLPGVFAL